MHKRNRVTIDCSKDGKTQQQFRRECDINHILAKFKKTGVINDAILNQRQQIFADVTEIGDFQDSQNKILAARDAFNTLPSAIRTRFGNDPGTLLDFCADPENKEEAIELGIFRKPEDLPPAPEPDPPTEPATKPAETPQKAS